MTLGGQRARCASGYDHVRLETDELGCQCRVARIMAFCPAKHIDDALTFYMTQFVQPLSKRIDLRTFQCEPRRAEVSDLGDLIIFLSTRAQRP